MEARNHALIVALILWSGAAIVTFSTSGPRNLVDHLKGEDFVQIYTLAHAAFEGAYPTLQTQQEFYARQVELVPASAQDRYLPVYPPTAALIFRPFAYLPYSTAVLGWIVVTILGYATVAWGASRLVNLSRDRGFLLRAAAAFPPFFLLVLYGQTTLIPLLAFALSWLALRARRPLLAGLALGLLSVKPQFALPIGIVLAGGMNGWILLGLGLSVGVQLAAVAWVMGPQALTAYAGTVSGLSAVEHLLEPDPWRMHSMRALTRLIADPAGDIAWVIGGLIVLMIAVRIWRSDAPVDARYGLVVIATVLVNPHLFAYDAVVLILPFLWLGGWLASIGDRFEVPFWQGVYLFCVLILLPTAAVIFVQASVLVLLWLFWRVSQRVTTTMVPYNRPA